MIKSVKSKSGTGTSALAPDLTTTMLIIIAVEGALEQETVVVWGVEHQTTVDVIIHSGDGEGFTGLLAVPVVCCDYRGLDVGFLREEWVDVHAGHDEAEMTGFARSAGIGLQKVALKNGTNTRNHSACFRILIPSVVTVARSVADQVMANAVEDVVSTGEVVIITVVGFQTPHSFLKTIPAGHPGVPASGELFVTVNHACKKFLQLLQTSILVSETSFGYSGVREGTPSMVTPSVIPLSAPMRVRAIALL